MKLSDLSTLGQRMHDNLATAIAKQKANNGPYDTKLAPADETAFTKWKAHYAPQDDGSDYDLRGAFKAGLKPDQASGHWPDTYKKPNHPTFSDQSQYAVVAPWLAGHWNGDSFVENPMRRLLRMLSQRPSTGGQ